MQVGFQANPAMDPSAATTGPRDHRSLNATGELPDRQEDACTYRKEDMLASSSLEAPHGLEIGLVREPWEARAV